MLPKKRRKLPLTRPKTPQELQDTRKAIRIIKQVLERLEPFNRTEREVASEIRKRIYEYNARLSFRPIVSSGRNTSFVHHKPGKRIIRRENPLMIDLGAKFRGQCSDITRMYIPKNKRLKKIYRDVSSIQKAVIRRLKPGADFKEINEFYKKMMKRKGYRVKHSIGHGLGPNIHERVRELKPGMVLTVEPGIYINNFGGCRIEDMVLIKKGGIEILSDSIPKNPYLVKA